MSDHEISHVLSFGSIDQMANENKGAFGEALAGIWLKDQIKKDLSMITEKEIPDTDPKFWFSHIGRHRCKYGVIDDDGREEITWEPDYSFQVTLPEYDIRKEILIEAKTGNSGLKRNQLDVMKLIAQEEDTLVFLSRITLHEDAAKISYEGIGTIDIEEAVEAEPDKQYECNDCGSEVDPETAGMDLDDGEAVYICPGGECD